MARPKGDVDVEVEDVSGNSITCEVCGSQYDRRAGSSNDCPTCNAPGGKSFLSATNKEAFAGMSAAAQAALENVTKNLSLITGRMTALEHKVSALEEKARG